MKILVHDFSGHPFQAQLARALARRSHQVTHLSCSSYVTGKGSLARRADDPDSLTFVDVPAPGGWHKDRYARRIVAERRYAREVFRVMRDDVRPDIVISSNIPLLAHSALSRRIARSGIPELFWHQDVYSAAIGDLLRTKLGGLGGLMGHGAERAERGIARRAAHIVAISEQFQDLYRQWGIAPADVTVQPNWAPIDELGVVEHENAWAAEHGLTGRSPVFLYAGTLGLKHNPARLLELANGIAGSSSSGCVVVASEGAGADFLRAQRTEDLQDRLLLLPFQPYERLPEMLGAADVLVTLLEKEAGRYSVPSKILTYHCAGRALLGSIPLDNAAATMVCQADSGLVVEPDDESGWLRSIQTLADEPTLRERYGRNARSFAERVFDVESIASRFEDILEGVLHDRVSRH